MRKITENLFVETEFIGCNPGILITKEGLILIDTPYRPTDSIKWRRELKKLGKVKYIINTEGHPDHVLGNAFFEGIVIAHQGAKDNFGASLERIGEVSERIREIDPKGMRLLNEYVPKEPSITFDHRLFLYVGDQVIELINLPGHTPDQIAVFIPKDRVVFTGDNVVYRTRPFYHRCQPREWMKSLEYLKRMDFDILIPGHGEVCGKEAVDEMISYNNDIFEQIERAVEKGLTKEETLEKVVFDERMPLIIRNQFSQQLERKGISRLYDQLISFSNK